MYLEGKAQNLLRLLETFTQFLATMVEYFSTSHKN